MRRILTLVASLARFRTAASPMLLLGVLFLGQGLLANNAHAWSWPSCRNYNGSSPEQPSTIYLGDTGTFGCDSWGTVDGHWGKHQVFIDQDNLIADGSSGSWL